MNCHTVRARFWSRLMNSGNSRTIFHNGCLRRRFRKINRNDGGFNTAIRILGGNRAGCRLIRASRRRAK